MSIIVVLWVVGLVAALCITVRRALYTPLGIYLALSLTFLGVSCWCDAAFKEWKELGGRDPALYKGLTLVSWVASVISWLASLLALITGWSMTIWLCCKSFRPSQDT